MEGITCVVCHRVKRPYNKANSRLTIQLGHQLQGCMYGPFDDAVIGQLNENPSQGARYLKTSVFCGACHDVASSQGVRLEEAFSE